MPARSKNLAQLLKTYADPLSPAELQILNYEITLSAYKAFEAEVRKTYDQAVLELITADKGRRSYFDSRLAQRLRENPSHTGPLVDLAETADERAAFGRRDTANRYAKILQDYKTSCGAELIRDRGLLVQPGDPNIYRLKPNCALPRWAQKLLDFSESNDMVLASQPALVIDRAARGGNWEHRAADTPIYHNTDGIMLEYASDEHASKALTLDEIALEVHKLNPRVADVWRLTTALVVSAWQNSRPEPVWVDIRDLAQSMGYTRKRSGVFRREALDGITDAYNHLRRMTITLPIGKKAFSVDPLTGERTEVVHDVQLRIPIIEIRQVEEIQQRGKTFAYKWKVALGEWAAVYPKQMAPLMNELVQLPAKGFSAWAKNLGMEFVFTYSRTQSIEHVFTIGELLKQSCLYDNAKALSEQRNVRRAWSYFVDALNELQRIGVLNDWSYVDEVPDRLNITTLSAVRVKVALGLPTKQRRRGLAGKSKR